MQWFIDIIKEWVLSLGYATQAWVEAKGYTTLTTVLAIASSVKDWVLGYCPKARAYLSANQSIPDRTWTRIRFDAETYDTHSLFANYKFTAAVTGYYLVIVTAHLTNPGLGTYFYAGSYKNGSRFSVKLIHAASTDSVGSTVTDIIYLEPGNYIEGYCFHSAGADRDILGGSHLTFMAISQIF